MDNGFRGPMSSVSTACATGLHAIGQAFAALQRGDAPMMLAGSTEACIDAVSLNGFCRMRALSTRFNDSPASASRPFDVARDGFVMGEGAGAHFALHSPQSRPGLISQLPYRSDWRILRYRL